MRKTFLFLCLGLALAAGAMAAAAEPGAAAPPRLVSLAPSLTEMVFALGAGDRLVGVTKHCRYPPAAASLPKVGGYQTPNYEAIMALRPDLVLTLNEHAPSLPMLDALGLRHAQFDHRSLEGVLESFTRLGEICGVPEKAAALRAALAKAFLPLTPPDGGERPKMLIIMAREYGRGGVANAYVIGRDGLYEKLIAAAGCQNAYTGEQAYPMLSGEGIAALDPDLVVEAIFGEMGSDIPDDRLLADWDSLANLRAVRNKRVHFLRAEYVFVPGARMILLRRDLLRLAFPGQFEGLQRGD